MKQVKAKLPKGVPQEFIDSIQSCTVDQLKARIVELQLSNAENEAFKDSEGYLQAQVEHDMANEAWALVSGPVKDTTTSIKNKTKLIIERLKEKGAI